MNKLSRGGAGMARSDWGSLTTRVALRLKPELLDAIRAAAEREHRSTASFIRLVLLEAVRGEPDKGRSAYD
jgi:hypothetical protein